MDFKCAVILLGLCLLVAVERSAAIKCHMCSSAEGGDCGKKFKKTSQMAEVICTKKCFKATYKIDGRKSYVRGCVQGDDCDDVLGMEPFKSLKSADVKTYCCKGKDYCNAATYVGMSKMAAITSVLLAIFTWLNKM